MSKVIYFLCQQIIPGFYAVRKNRVIRKEYLKQLNFSVAVSNKNENLEEIKSKMENLLKIQLERKIKLEDKAKSLLFVVSLSFTIVFFAISFLKNTNIFESTLALLGISCFVFASIRVVEAINIRSFHITEIPEIIVDMENKKFVVVKENEEKYLNSLVQNKQLNDLTYSQIANLTYASHILVRNGVIFFSLFFVSTLF